MANQIHVVPHFHWDREWYFTAEESKILLVNDMEEIMDMLETNPDYPYFVLDGQTSILEDYLSVKPENKDRLQNLITQGRLIIGPWYTQTDEMVVGGESIVRNLLYGKLDCEKFGPRMMIGYLPDSFGQSARLPQILNGFDIRRCMFWRGTSERMGTSKTEFYWEGDTGAKVLVQLLPLGYAIGKYLPIDKKELKERMDKYLEVLDAGATTDHILLPNGHDQMPVQKNIFEVMRQIEDCYPGRKTTLGKYEDLFDLLEKETNLDTIRGEFLDGKYMRVHRSIYSARADLKAANTRIENKITNILEPLASIAYSLGFSYEHGLIENIWKELLKNHAHDSIGCCCSDKVHRAIADRFFLAEERTDRLIDFYKRKIVDAMSTEESIDKLTIFNTLPYERKGTVVGEIITRMRNFQLQTEDGASQPFEIIESHIVDAGLIDRQIVHYGNYDPFVKYTVAFEDVIPSMGYKTYLIKEAAKEMPAASQWTEHANVLENEYYHIVVEANGTLTVTDKENGNVYQNVLLVEDGSDDGDEYDYSPLENDFVLTSETAKATCRVRKSDCLSEAEIAFSLSIPDNLESRKQQIIDGRMDVTFHIALKKNSRSIAIKMTVDNQAKDHRVRVYIPTLQQAACSICDNPFGSIRRPVKDAAIDVWEEEHWSERPDSIYPFLSFVHTDSKEGMAVLTNSVREYEIISKEYDTIALTIFRSVGVLGKENLYRRPGRPSGIKMETPDSQMPGKQTYRFALTTDIPHAPQQAKEYTTPLVTYNKMPYNAMKLNVPVIETPYHYSLLQADNPAAVMSACKKEEQGDGLLLRFYNAGEQPQDIEVQTPWQIKGETRLDETLTDGIPNGEPLSLLPNENKTILLTTR